MRHLKAGPVYLVRMDKGEKIVEGLAGLCGRLKIRAGLFQAIGTCRGPELGYFETARKKYLWRKLRGEFEILSLQGNVSSAGGRPFIHGHVVLGGRDFVARGGHLKEAEVAATCEVVLTPLPVVLMRSFDRASGLNLWQWTRSAGRNGKKGSRGGHQA